jgi:hypothetical protein
VAHSGTGDDDLADGAAALDLPVRGTELLGGTAAAAAAIGQAIASLRTALHDEV